MEVYKFKNYEEYIEMQKRVNAEKVGWVYVKKSTIKQISEDSPYAIKILCHGTRAAAEQKFFKEFLPQSTPLGTEIGENALDYPMTIQHDFNKPIPGWHGEFDIVYSNSIDHSIDPSETIRVWKNQLTENGKMYIEYSEQQSVPNYPQDPLHASAAEIKNLLQEQGLVIVGEITKDVKAGGIVFICKKK